jgi:tRNA uridine 5-carbamoylmethylation protein Kti12
MFKKAQRTKAKLKLAITGPSGSGKTYSALRLAKGLGGKIAVIDTENGSASLYSDRFDFDVLEIRPPFSNDKYIGAIEASVKGGYDVLIIDSLTHQWAGEGGLLNKKEQLDARGGNSFANWAKMTPEHEKFKSSILHSNIHVIATMRSKQDYVLSENDKGKQAPKKVGLAPIQRDGLEYEFTTVFDCAMNHEAMTSKDRTGLFGDRAFLITEETGAELSKWLSAAANVPEQSKEQMPEQKKLVNHADEVVKKIAESNKKAEAEQAGLKTNNNIGKQSQTSEAPPKADKDTVVAERLDFEVKRKELVKISRLRNWETNDVSRFITKVYQKPSSRDLDVGEIDHLIDIIKTKNRDAVMLDLDKY